MKTWIPVYVMEYSGYIIFACFTQTFLLGKREISEGIKRVHWKSFYISSKILVVGCQIRVFFCFHEKTDISSIEANKNLYKPSKKEWNSSTEYQKPLENTSWGGSMRNMKTVKEAATLTEHWEAESRVENHVVVKNQLFTFIIPLPLECEPKMKVPEHVREV